MHFLDARVRAGMPVVPPLLHMGHPADTLCFQPAKPPLHHVPTAARWKDHTFLSQ